MRHNEDIKKYFKTREIGEGLTEEVKIKLIPQDKNGVVVVGKRSVKAK